MPKKETLKEEPTKEHIEEKPVTDIMEENFMPYAASVIVSRALPEIDGWKPSHRKVLYTMYTMGLTGQARSKSSTIAGQVLKLNPHSDASAYDTMVRLTDDNETLLAPVVDSKGNFGKHYSRDMACAASRYCVGAGTLIPTDSGLVRIGELSKGVKENDEKNIDIKIKSLGQKQNRASKVFNSGRQPTKNITLESGNSIMASENHPILTQKRGGSQEWVLAKDLKKGDMCVVDTSTKNVSFGSYADTLDAAVIGAIYSCCEWIDEKTIEFKSEDNKLLLPLFMYFDENFPLKKKRQIDELESGGEILYRYTVKFSSKKAIEKFVGFSKFDRENPKKRSLPECAMSGTKEFMQTMISYFFNGCESEVGEGYIQFGSNSKQFMKDCQIILQSMFGIMCYISSYNKNSKTIIKIEKDYYTKLSRNFKINNKSIQEELDTGKEQLDRPYVAVPIKTVLPSGKLIVYSIKVESECHSFSGNGFINHNTEAKLSKISDEFFKGINKNAVDFVDNFDSTTKEPTLLPVTFPNILANPTQGIAVGMASNICSFNLKELCEATILHIRKKNADIMEVMKGPDFTTGAYLLFEKEVMEKIYDTGKGSIKLRAKYRIDKKNNTIEVLEIPYTTTIEAIIEDIVSLIKSGKIKEISDVRDEIGKDGFKLAIDYKRNCDPELLMKKLFKLTKLQDSFGCNFNILIDGRPKTLGVYSILDEWTKWRQVCVERELGFDLSKKEKELHLLKGLEKIILDIDRTIKIIRDTENDKDVVPNLMSAFSIDEEQGTYIADIKLRNLNKEYLVNRTKDIKVLEDDILKIKKSLSDKKEINKIIIKQLQEVAKKYGKPRKTEIIDFVEDDTDVTTIIDNYPLVIIRTNDGYIKKIPQSSIRVNTEVKFKDGDYKVQDFKIMNKDELLFFTNKCNCYKVLACDIKDCRPSDFGEYINNILELQKDEEVIFMHPLDNKKIMIIAFENGKVAKFPMSGYETKNNRKKLINAISDKSPIVRILAIDEDGLFGITGTNGKLLAFDSEAIALKATKTTQGVQVLRLPSGAKVNSFGKLSDYNLKNTRDYGCRAFPGSGKMWKGKKLEVHNV